MGFWGFGIAESPHPMILYIGNDRGHELWLLLWNVADVVSHGIGALSAGGGNTPGDRDLLGRSGLLGGVDARGSRRVRKLHLPGL